MGKEILTQVQETQRVPNRIKPRFPVIFPALSGGNNKFQACLFIVAQLWTCQVCPEPGFLQREQCLGIQGGYQGDPLLQAVSQTELGSTCSSVCLLKQKFMPGSPAPTKAEVHPRLPSDLFCLFSDLQRLTFVSRLICSVSSDLQRLTLISHLTCPVSPLTFRGSPSSPI